MKKKKPKPAATNGTKAIPFPCEDCLILPACYGLDDGKSQHWYCTACHLKHLTK